MGNAVMFANCLEEPVGLAMQASRIQAEDRSVRTEDAGGHIDQKPRPRRH